MVFFLPEFRTLGSAQRALSVFTGPEWKLKGRHALTPRHLHMWLKNSPPQATRPPEQRVIPPPSEQEALQVMEGLRPCPALLAQGVAFWWARPSGGGGHLVGTVSGGRRNASESVSPHPHPPTPPRRET